MDLFDGAAAEATVECVADPVASAAGDLGEAALKRVVTALQALAFTPLPNGVRTLRDALYVLGLPDRSGLTMATLNQRFRQLAPIYHQDTGLVPCADRMVQLIDARDLLARHLSRSRLFGLL